MHDNSMEKKVLQENQNRDVQPTEYPSGIKWTRQRKTVYDVLKQAQEPMNAVQIFRLAEQRCEETYALSTIYRILSAFEERGIVEKNTWPEDGTVVYELERGEHTHYAVCLECHKRIPLHSCPFSMARLAGTHTHGAGQDEMDDFAVVSHKVELYGYCKDCRAIHEK